MFLLKQLFEGGSHRQARVRNGTLLVFLTGLVLGVFFLRSDSFLGQPFLGEQQLALSDTLFRSGDISQDIVLAEIDDRSLRENGPFAEWRRTLHAQAVANLSHAGARLIVFDLLFVDPSEDDAVLAQAIKSAGNVVMGVTGADPLAGDGADQTFRAVLAPQEPLRSAAALLGHINAPADDDGVVRRVPMFINDAEGNQYPALAVASVYGELQRQPPPRLSESNGSVAVLGQKVPVDVSGAMRPNFVGVLSDFERLSYADVIAGTFDPATVRNKTVLIGLTASGSGDYHVLPLGGSQPGIVAHANAMNSLKSGIFVRESSRNQIAIGLVPLIAVAMYAVPRFDLRLTALLLFALAVANSLFFIFLFNSDQKLIMNFIYPGGLLPTMYVVGLIHRVNAERADRRELGELFGRYASPEIVQELVAEADRGQLSLGGTLRDATVLFADLRGFTSVSERMPPEEVVMFLNKAFDVMITSIVRNDGIVNKFGGDMVMAIWNAPQETPGHALKACRAAFQALAEMERLGLQLPDAPTARFGFGINTGEVVAGNVGSAGRLEYTVMGDPVNVASRLCGIAGGGEVYVGERTRALAGDAIEARSLGPTTLKGRTQAVEAYQILSVDPVSAPAVEAGG